MGIILLLSSAGVNAKVLSKSKAPPRTPADTIQRPDLGYGPPSGELDLPDVLWGASKERYWRDRTPEGHVIFQRLLAKAKSPLPARAQQSCAAWLSGQSKSPCVSALLYAHLFGPAPRGAHSSNRFDHSCIPSNDKTRWSCRLDRFAKASDTVPTATVHVELLADKQILLLNTLHCSLSHAL